MGRKCFETAVPFAAMVASQCVFSGVKVISKAAMSNGMSNYVFVVYSGVISVVLLFLAHLFLQRKTNMPPPITFRLLRKFFILGFLGTTLTQNLMFLGINYSSPTMSSAISNLDPALTFLLAVIFRFEKLNLRLLRSHVKIIGTLVSVAGALIMTLYKGPALWATLPSNSTLSLFQPTANNWVFGGFCFAVASLSSVSCNILLASVLQEYPSVTTIVLFNILFGTMQGAVISLIAERDLNAWKLSLDIGLGAIVYAAVGGAAGFYLLVWSIGKKGPVFVAMFSPLGIIIAALMSAIFLGDTLHVGSVVGAVIIVAGFYGVIWAQSKDQEDDEHHTDCLPSSSSQKVPLLPENR